VDIEALLQLDGHNVHDRSVGTVSISATGAADLSKVDDWLGELLWETGKDVEVYRMKGVFHVYGSDKMHMLQAVRELYEILPSQPWQPEDKRVNRIVIIGKNLNRESLLASFRTCLVS
jgi:G3E family GTPase